MANGWFGSPEEKWKLIKDKVQTSCFYQRKRDRIEIELRSAGSDQQNLPFDFDSKTELSQPNFIHIEWKTNSTADKILWKLIKKKLIPEGHLVKISPAESFDIQIAVNFLLVYSGF